MKISSKAKAQGVKRDATALLHRLRSGAAEFRLTMPSINLLPWREAQRQRRRKEFLIGIGAAVGLAALVTVARARCR